VPEPPTRKMPESSSREEAVEAAISHMSPTRVPKLPKPILKTPHFELGQEHVPSPAQKPTETTQETEALDPFSKLSDVGGAEESVLEQDIPSRSTAPFLAATKA